MIFDGYSFEETSCDLTSIPRAAVDQAIFTIGWEDRAEALLKSGAITGEHAYCVRFDGDGVENSKVSSFIAEAKKNFQKVDLITLGSALDKLSWEGSLEKFVTGTMAEAPGYSVFIDYTCMPKAITQTLYRMLLKRTNYPKTFWGYCEGKYEASIGNVQFDQGLSGKFFPIRFTPGKGGTSNERALILALGGDPKLIFTLLEQADRDHIYVLTASAPSSAELFHTAHDQKSRLMREFHVPQGNFVEANAASVNNCLGKYLSIVRALPKACAIEIFCSGPKSHAVAACAIAEKFSDTVSLLGRTPLEYSRHNVPASGPVSISTVTNFCNPDVRQIL
ncbi:hypothetical protein [uncultured Roseobacter sp.]|uniref:hypothetical protein n=1 Tax=uncultured Roseobacter sp. TaxID=114847 RepID=UPI00262DD1A6|nr:hypothetical protein [uncultured Roseobacter sp.]